MRLTFVRPALASTLACALVGFTISPRASAQYGANALSYSDVDFVKQLYQDVITAHKLANLAVNNAKKSEIRQLGGNVLESLRQAREQIKVLARKKGVEISDELNAQNQGVVDKLSSASYDEVDRTYLDQMLTYLPRILQACQSTAASTQDPDLKAFLTGVVPAIQARIAAVEAAKSNL